MFESVKRERFDSIEFYSKVQKDESENFAQTLSEERDENHLPTDYSDENNRTSSRKIQKNNGLFIHKKNLKKLKQHVPFFSFSNDQKIKVVIQKSS